MKKWIFLIFILLFFKVIFSENVYAQSCDLTCKNQGFASGTCESSTSGLVASTELINYAGMTTNEVNTFIDLCEAQGLTELTLRLNAYSDCADGLPSTNYVNKAKEIITAANAVGIAINIDLHTWHSTGSPSTNPCTWEDGFDDDAPNHESIRDLYLTYVQNSIEAFDGYDVKTWMVLNEPQAQRATDSENNFILDVIATAKEVTSKPISVRFMGTASPTTGHYASSIDQACDFISRTCYWDARTPENQEDPSSRCSGDKIQTAINSAHSQGKEFWIVEFGRYKDDPDLEEQRDYVENFVSWSKLNDIDAVFCWVSQPEGGSGERYNIFTDYTPNPAFYELVSDSTTPTCSGTSIGQDGCDADQICCCSGSATQTLVGYWSFDDCTAKDYSDYHNDGVVSGASCVSGKVGYGLEFDGIDDYVQINDDNSLDLTDELTITAWIYPRSFGENNFGRIVDKEFNLAYSFYIRSATPDSITLGIEGTSYHSNQDVIDLNRWQHVAVIFNRSNSQIKFYVNGQSEGSTTRSSSIPITTSNLYIGNNANLDRTFDGIIDEVKIWNRALTGDEIRNEYESGSTTTSTTTSPVGGSTTTTILKKTLQQCEKEGYDCSVDGMCGYCMRGSAGCRITCKSEKYDFGYCVLPDFMMGYVPGCGERDCCCLCFGEITTTTTTPSGGGGLIVTTTIPIMQGYNVRTVYLNLFSDALVVIVVVAIIMGIAYEILRTTAKKK